jgi:hypothetical protein
MNGTTRQNPGIHKDRRVNFAVRGFSGFPSFAEVEGAHFLTVELVSGRSLDREIGPMFLSELT